MRTIFFSFGIALGIFLGLPALAQVAPGQTEATQGQPDQTLRSGGATEPAPGLPSLQDIRSPLTTIMNRPATGPGGRQGAPGTQPELAPGARAPISPTDLQQRIQEFQFEQLKQELQAEQAERNEFQQFIMQSTGRDLPIFGANLFRSVPSTFAPVDNVPVTPDYVIGPGDEIQIRAWGQIDVDFSATVDRSGTISVPARGRDQCRGHQGERPAHVSEDRVRAHVPQLPAHRDARQAALDPGLRRRTGETPRHLHRELALDARQRGVRRGRPLEQGLDAEHPVEARQPGGDRFRPLRPDPLWGTSPRTPSSFRAT